MQKIGDDRSVKTVPAPCNFLTSQPCSVALRPARRPPAVTGASMAQYITQQELEAVHANELALNKVNMTPDEVRACQGARNPTLPRPTPPHPTWVLPTPPDPCAHACNSTYTPCRLVTAQSHCSATLGLHNKLFPPS